MIMFEFVSFDRADLEKAIKNKNYRWIKGAAMNAMWNDPAFEYGELYELLEILKKEKEKDKDFDIFEEEQKLSYEKRLERSLWDRGYFVELTYWFRENFALSRIPYIEEVGKAISKKSPEQDQQIDAQKEDHASTKNSDSEIKRQETTKQNFHKPGMVIAAIILVILLVLLLKNLFK